MLIVYFISMLVCFIVALVEYAFATEDDAAGFIATLIVVGLIPAANSALAVTVLLVSLVQFIYDVVAKGIEKRVGKNG